MASSIWSWSILLVLLLQFYLCVTSREFRSLASITFAELQTLAAGSGNLTARARLHRIVRAEGALLLVGAPGLEGAVQKALSEVGACMTSPVQEPGAKGPVTSHLPGGITRSTLATTTTGGTLEPWPAWALNSCPKLQSSSADLRGLVAMLTETFARGVDEVAGTGGGRERSLERLVRQGTHLEHFHRYTRPETTVVESEADRLVPRTLHMHTDAGVLLALVVRWQSQQLKHRHHARDSGIEFLLPDNSIVSAEPIDEELTSKDGSGLLFFFGEGAAAWLPEMQTRAAPHALSLAGMRLDEERLAYGVMALPPDSWVLGPPVPDGAGQVVTFGEWWRRARAALGDDSASGNDTVPLAVNASLRVPWIEDGPGVGCLSAHGLRRKLEDQAASCDAGQVYCWLQCRSAEHLSCSAEEARCARASSGDSCPSPPEHCFDGELQCPCADCTSLAVTGAGEDAFGSDEGIVNGLFVLDGTISGRPSYRKVYSPGWVVWDAELMQWLLYVEGFKNGSAMEPLYYSAIAGANSLPDASQWLPWRGSLPAPSCQLIRDSDSSSDERGDDFCALGALTDMHMGGFVWTLGRSQVHPCLILLFSSFELTDALRFSLGLFGVIVAGVFAEGAVALRRRVEAQRTRPPRFWRAQRLALYFMSRALGYLVMLATMTYSAEFFLAVLVGLTLGHYIFNLQAPVGEDITCCTITSQAHKDTAGQPPVDAHTLIFSVKGMTCESCVGTVRGAVEALTIVHSVTELVRSTGIMTVVLFPPGSLQDASNAAERIAEAVEEVGFAAEQLKQPDPDCLPSP